jgi:hypothetical protein
MFCYHNIFYLYKRINIFLFIFISLPVFTAYFAIEKHKRNSDEFELCLYLKACIFVFIQRNPNNIENKSGRSSVWNLFRSSSSSDVPGVDIAALKSEVLALEV